MNLDGIFVKAEVKKQKKGTGMASALSLMQDFIEFKSKIEDCVEAQDLTENKEKIKGFLNEISKMYDVLIEIAKTGVKSMNEEEIPAVEERPVDTKLNADDLKGYTKPSPVLSVPQIPRM
jgi:dTDP-glucose pyrophosphorylase